MENNSDDATPGFAFIDVPSEDPFVLFNEWYEQVQQSDLVMPQVFTLATVDGDAKVSARSLLLKHLDAEGDFVFVSDRRSRKGQGLVAVPSAAMVFCWTYKNNADVILRQVRVEGMVTEMAPEECQVLYDAEVLYSKMRSHLCAQGQQVEWQGLQDSYGDLLGKVKEGQPLPMPDHFAGYKLTADVIEFYKSENKKIADRILFQKEGKCWKHHRIAA